MFKKKSNQTKKSPIKIKEQSISCPNSITYRSKFKKHEHTSSTGPGTLNKQVTSRSKSYFRIYGIFERFVS